MAAAGLLTTPSRLILWAKEVQRISQSGENGLLQNETVTDVLTPGMNDNGLGPNVSEYTFGHGGVDCSSDVTAHGSKIVTPTVGTGR
jgi:hypothetical protein